MEGKCLCGKVSLVTADKTHFEVCHCGMCRRWGGGPFFGFHCEGELAISGEHNVKTFKSSEWAERAFCGSCGTHLYYKIPALNQHVLPVGLFQHRDNYQFSEQIFIDKKPGFYAFSNKTPELTEQQVFEKYTP
ncbi:MAG TPA: GFA family protein [Marinagarivorans sp.]